MAGRSASERPLNAEQLLTETVWLASLARGLLHDEHEAEDVAQEVRLAALARAPEDPERARSWLASVARNLALRARLRRSRRDRREQLAAAPESLPSTLDLVARVHAQRRVVDAVLALAEPYRSVVLLRYFDALTARNIATRQGVPIETVRTRLKRALAQLRAQLDASFGARDAWAGLLLPWAAKGSGAAATATASSTAVVATSAAAVVVAGAATMSLTTKLASAALVIVASVLAWKITHLEATPATVHSVDAAATSPPPAEAAAMTEETSGASAAPATATAARTEESAPTTTPASTADGLRFIASIVEAADGKPIVGAELRLRDARGTGDPSATSDAEGHINLFVASIGERRFECEVFAADHAPRVDRSILQLSGARDGVLDLGEIRLERGAVVRGRVVRSRDGMGIAGADLRLDETLTGSMNFGPRDARRVGTSRADGSFELDERAASRLHDSLTLFAVTSEGIGWTFFDVVRGRERIDDLEIRIETPARLHVTVHDESGLPIEGAAVRAEPHFLPLGSSIHEKSEHAMYLGDDPRNIATFGGTSDASGQATFDRLPIGRAARALEHRDGGSFDRYDVVATKAGFDRGFTDGVRVNVASATSCEVVLHPTRTFSVIGRVLDLDGEPIADARVYGAAGKEHQEVATDEEGEYLIDGLPTTNGHFYFQVLADGFAMKQQDFALAELKAPYAIDFTLERSGKIAGTVVDEQGAPITGAALWFQRVEGGRVDDISYCPELNATGVDGRFTFDATEIEWQLRASAPIGAGQFGPATIRRVHGGDVDLVVECRVTKPLLARLIAEIVDATTGEPAEPQKSYLRLLSPDVASPPYGKTDRALGRIEHAPLVPGHWRLDVELTNGWRAMLEFDVTAPDEVVTLRVEVGPPPRVEARLHRTPGLELPVSDIPWKRVLVFWTQPVGHQIDDEGKPALHVSDGCARFDANDRFVASGFIPGDLVRFWMADDDLYDEVFVRPESGKTTTIDLTPIPAAKLQLVRSADLPDGMFDLKFSCNDGPWHWRSAGWQAESPTLTFPQGLKAGHHRWRVRFTPRDPAATTPIVRALEGEFDVAAGETHVLELTGLR